jgi:hypothetical protein
MPTEFSSGDAVGPGDGEGTIVLHLASGQDISINVVNVPSSSARNDMPRLIRESAKSNRAFLIRNAKTPNAASALLVSPSALESQLDARPRRTLGQLIDNLPFRRNGLLPHLSAEMPSDVVEEFVVHEIEPADEAPARTQRKR